MVCDAYVGVRNFEFTGAGMRRSRAGEVGMGVWGLGVQLPSCVGLYDAFVVVGWLFSDGCPSRCEGARIGEVVVFEVYDVCFWDRFSGELDNFQRI